MTAGEVDAILRDQVPEPVWEMYRDRSMTESLVRYIALLSKWNRVVNLTSVRTPEEMVRRHIAESLCCAVALPRCVSVLDLGSGAGFPGIPVQLMRPEVTVTLAESHGRKAAFLREVVRELGLRTEVFAGRAQDLAARSFEGVCLRAVDPIEQALAAASELASDYVCVVGSKSMDDEYRAGLLGWDLWSVRWCLAEEGSSIFVYGRSG